MTIPFLKHDQSPSPVTLGGPVCTAIATAFTTQTEELVDEMNRLHHRQNCLAQEAEDAEKEGDRMSNWVFDVKDQRADMESELCQVELEIRRKKEEMAQLEARKREWEASRLNGPVVTSSVSGQHSQGASAGPGAPKKKKKDKQMPKRHPGLALQEGQEFYKLYIAHL